MLTKLTNRNLWLPSYPHQLPSEYDSMRNRSSSTNRPSERCCKITSFGSEDDREHSGAELGKDGEIRSDPAEGDRWRTPARIRSVELGDLRVSYVPDGVVEVKSAALFPETSSSDWENLQSLIDDSGYLASSSGGLLVEDGRRALLIDSGYGPLSAPADPANQYIGAIRGGGLLSSLSELGCDAADIEAVAFTHLHFDHVGWAAQADASGRANVFRNARYLFSEQEWRNRQPSHGVTGSMIATLESRAQTVVSGEEIFPGVRVISLPGHTLGHIGFMISSGGNRLLAFGDVMHTTAQLNHPDWTLPADPDNVAAIRSRRQTIDLLTDTSIIGAGGHFADVVFGQIRASGAELIWQPLP